MAATYFELNRRSLTFLLCLLLLPSLLYAQSGACRKDEVKTQMSDLKGAVKMVNGVRVTIYAYTDTNNTTPLTLYTDPTLSVTKANPLTTDSHGEYSYCVAAGTTVKEVIGAGTATVGGTYQPITIAGAGIDTNNNFTGVNSFSKCVEDSTIRCASHYASIQAAIDAASVAAPRTVIDDLPAGNYAGFEVKSGVTFIAAPWNQKTITSLVAGKPCGIVVDGGNAGLIGVGGDNTRGSNYVAGNGLNGDVICSDTVWALITSVVRASNVVTVTTLTPHGLTTGAKVGMVVQADPTFTGANSGNTITVTGANTFTYANTGSDATVTMSNTPNGAGWVVAPDTVGWQSSTISGINVDGNNANNSYGSGIHVSFPCENAYVDKLLVRNTAQDGIVISMAVAGAGILGDWSAFRTNGHGFSLEIHENSVYVTAISGDHNHGSLLRATGHFSSSIIVGFIKSEAQTDTGAGQTYQDPVVYLQSMANSAVPSFTVLSGYMYGPAASPKNAIYQISTAGEWTIENARAVYMENYTYCVDDLKRPVQIALAKCVRTPYHFTVLKSGMRFSPESFLEFANTTKLRIEDNTATEKDVLFADSGNNVYAQPIGASFFIRNSAGQNVFEANSSNAVFSKPLFGNVSAQLAQFISNTANRADSGTFRLAAGDAINWRNAANGANISLAKNANDRLGWNSNSLLQALSCGTTTTCSNTASTDYRMIFGEVTLSSGTATITGISPAFTSSSSYFCTVTDTATTPAAASYQRTSSSSITVKGGTSAVIHYQCIGN